MAVCVQSSIMLLGIALVGLVAGGAPTCDTCESFITKFSEQMENTKGKSSGAGNTEWEESRGIKYDSSEARLFEILEHACGKGDHKCNAIVEENEEAIENWWSKREAFSGFDSASFRSYICVKEAKACCETGFFGKKCSECPGGSATPCSGVGVCQGSGTRTGKGKCKCQAGYIGKRCAKCHNDYYKSAKDENAKDQALSYDCQKCDDSCARGCTGAGNSMCKSCADGYEKETATGNCVDIDECESDSICSGATFCKNTPGNVTCEKCHKGCHPDDGCSGPGPKDCKEATCADGYSLDADLGCIDVDECAGSPCDANQFCVDTEGAYQCKGCSSDCGDLGCTNAQASTCKNCAVGYKVPDGKEIGCQDVDECESATRCGDEKCINTKGSFTCEAIVAATEDGDVATSQKDEL